MVEGTRQNKNRAFYPIRAGRLVAPTTAFILLPLRMSQCRALCLFAETALLLIQAVNLSPHIPTADLLGYKF